MNQIDLQKIRPFVLEIGFNFVAPSVVSGGGGAGAVATVFGRTGTIVATTGDYTASQVGADSTGTAVSTVATHSALNGLGSHIPSTGITDSLVSTSAAIAQSKISGLSTSLGLKADLTDSRFTDARNPINSSVVLSSLSTAVNNNFATSATFASHTASTGLSNHIPATGITDALVATSAAIAQSKISGLSTSLSGKVDTTDPRLTDSRNPLAGSVVLASLSTAVNNNFATAAQGTLAASALQAGTAIANVSGLQAAIDGKQGLNARLTAIASQANPATVKLPQLNTDGTISFIDPPSGAGGLVASNNLSDVASVSTARTNLGLGTAATTASTAYATSAQGTLAASALQLGTAQSNIANLVADLASKQGLNARLTAIAAQANPATVKLAQLGTDGILSFVDPPAGGGGGGLVPANNLSDLVSIPTARTNLGLGTAAIAAASSFATSAQGTLAASAIQSIPWASPGTIGSTAPNTGVFTDLTATGRIQAASYTTGTLPSAAANPRSIVFDSTLGVLVASNGSDWAVLRNFTPTTQIFYSDGGTSYSITIPALATRYRVRYVSAGGGAGSGAACTTTTLAAGGGAGGNGGFYGDINGLTAELVALGASVLDLTLGLPGTGGAGVVGLSTLVVGSPGAAGGVSSLAVNAVVFHRMVGGNPGNGGTATTATAGTVTSNTSGGVAGGAGNIGQIIAGNAAVSSNTADVCAGGGGAAGFTTGNAANNGGTGGKGGLLSRNPTEALTAAETNATAILVNGSPCPGNGGGGGSSNAAGTGGNGANGGGGGASAGSRTTSLPGGTGGRSWAVVQFF